MMKVEAQDLMKRNAIGFAYIDSTESLVWIKYFSVSSLSLFTVLFHSLRFSFPLSMFFKVFPPLHTWSCFEKNWKIKWSKVETHSFKSILELCTHLLPGVLPSFSRHNLWHRYHIESILINWHTRHKLICIWNEKSRFGSWEVEIIATRSKEREKERRKREGEREKENP